MRNDDNNAIKKYIFEYFLSLKNRLKIFGIDIALLFMKI